MTESAWAGRALIIGVCLGLVLLPQIAFAQNVDPTTSVTQILTFLTSGFGRGVVALIIAVIGIGCMIGHHPLYAIATVCLGAFMLFGAQFYATNWFGAGG